MGVTHHPALRSPDVPRRSRSPRGACSDATVWPAHLRSQDTPRIRLTRADGRAPWRREASTSIGLALCGDRPDGCSTARAARRREDRRLRRPATRCRRLIAAAVRSCRPTRSTPSHDLSPVDLTIAGVWGVALRYSGYGTNWGTHGHDPAVNQRVRRSDVALERVTSSRTPVKVLSATCAATSRNAIR